MSGTRECYPLRRISDMEKAHTPPIASDRVHATQVIRDGIIAGLLGALVVAGIHLITDLVAGEPLRTPTALGVLLLGGGEAAANLGIALRFTCIHAVAWVMLAVLASWLISMADVHPRLAATIFAVSAFVFINVMYLAGALSVPGLPPHHLWVGTLLGSAAAGAWLLRRHPWLTRHIEREHLTEVTRIDLERALDREAADLFAYQSIATRFPDSIFGDLVEAKRARSAMLHSRCEELGLPATEFPETAHEWEATTLDGAYREALAFERITIDFYDRFLAAVSEMQIRELFLRLRCEVLDETIPQLERAIEFETSGKNR
jgi:hypothetical protein